MNLHQKLIEVRKSCKYLKKDNKGYKFQYVSSSQTLGTLRGKMDEVGVLLIPSVESYEVRDHTTKSGDTQYFTILNVKFTWVDADNPDDKIECSWTGQGLDSGEKGVGKALTYAEKYFMLKFFNIATDKDDPDAFQDKTDGDSGQVKSTESPKPKKGNKSITQAQRKKLFALMTDAGLNKDEARDLFHYVEPETKEEASKFIDKFDDYLKLWKQNKDKDEDF